jgi:hypothetical protein
MPCAKGKRRRRIREIQIFHHATNIMFKKNSSKKKPKKILQDIIITLL